MEAVLSAEASEARINLENLRMTAPGTRVAGATTGRLEKERRSWKAGSIWKFKP